MENLRKYSTELADKLISTVFCFSSAQHSVQRYCRNIQSDRSSYVFEYSRRVKPCGGRSWQYARGWLGAWFVSIFVGFCAPLQIINCKQRIQLFASGPRHYHRYWDRRPERTSSRYPGYLRNDAVNLCNLNRAPILLGIIWLLYSLLETSYSIFQPAAVRKSFIRSYGERFIHYIYHHNGRISARALLFQIRYVHGFKRNYIAASRFPLVFC